MAAMLGFLYLALSSSISHALTKDVRWLQYVQQTQLQLHQNTSINKLPTCSTWLSNNYQIPLDYNRTVRGLAVRGKYCFRVNDCIRGQVVFQNNGLSISEQLEAGVRRLVVELHYVPKMKKGMLRVCGSIERKHKENLSFLFHTACSPHC